MFRYYTLIPTVGGRQKLEIISTEDTLFTHEERLKFLLRMGFEDMEEEEEGLLPISGVMEQPLPISLKDAASSICPVSEINKCTNKGKALAAKKAGKPVKKMDENLYGAIMLYTGNAIYKTLNATLRAENRKGIKRYFQYLRMLFEAMGSLPTRNTTLWRGVAVDLSAQYKVGSTITWWGVRFPPLSHE